MGEQQRRVNPRATDHSDNKLHARRRSVVRSGFQERDKSRLPEVMIGRERIPHAQLAHQGKTHAVGERPLFVRVAMQQRRAGEEPFRTDSLQP